MRKSLARNRVKVKVEAMLLRHLGKSRHLAFLLICLLACRWSHGVPAINDSHLKITTFASGLSQPTGFAFLDNNDMLVIERTTGRVKRLQGNTVSQALDLNVESYSERGLLGIAVSPTFTTDHHVYLYYSTTSSTGDSNNHEAFAGNRLSMFTWSGSALVSEVPLFTVALDTSDLPYNNGPVHNGGPIKFGPDGKLYGVMGDLNRTKAEQNYGTASSQVGGVYRLNPDGSIPNDNPFASNPVGDVQKWYAYGVRNSFGLAFDPQTNALWDTENGDSLYDEVNLVAPGFNSGWRKIMGPASRSGVSPDTLVQLPGSTYSDPEFSWLGTVAPTGIEFLARGTSDPVYANKVIVGDNNNGRLYMFSLNANRDGFAFTGNLADLVADSSSELAPLIWGTGFNIPTQIQVGPDNALYIASLSSGTMNSGAIYRIDGFVPEPAGLGIVVISPLLMSRRRKVA